MEQFFLKRRSQLLIQSHMPPHHHFSQFFSVQHFFFFLHSFFMNINENFCRKRKKGASTSSNTNGLKIIQLFQGPHIVGDFVLSQRY